MHSAVIRSTMVSWPVIKLKSQFLDHKHDCTIKYLDMTISQVKKQNWPSVIFKQTGHTWKFSAIFLHGDTFCDFLFASLHIKQLLKRVFSKRKEFAPIGSKFFPVLEKTPFWRGQNQVWHLSPLKVYPFTLRGADTFGGSLIIWLIHYYCYL